MNPLLVTKAGGGETQDRAHFIQNGDCVVLIVADGVGGRSGGAEAAEMAVDQIQRGSPRLLTADDCVRALRETDQTIYTDRVAGETTCVVVVISSNSVFGASVGDSGAWGIGSESYVDLTRHQNRKPFIGSGIARPVPFAMPSRPATGLLLVATDGLLKYTSAESICRECQDPCNELAAESLLSLVRLASGNFPDDTTLILYRL